jgi:hypothetical protein
MAAVQRRQILTGGNLESYDPTTPCKGLLADAYDFFGIRPAR